VSFKAGNWLEQGCASNKYEVVTCFSVSKWVHLNWGDDGLMKLFHKFYRWVPLLLLLLLPRTAVVRLWWVWCSCGCTAVLYSAVLLLVLGWEMLIW
jgi:hypothetical protein